MDGVPKSPRIVMSLMKRVHVITNHGGYEPNSGPLVESDFFVQHTHSLLGTSVDTHCSSLLARDHNSLREVFITSFFFELSLRGMDIVFVVGVGVF